MTRSPTGRGPLWFLLAALCAAVAALACDASPQATTAGPPLVTVVPVDSRDLTDQIEASGELVAVEHAEIAAEVAGRITEILRDEGDAVEEGEVLLRIDPERHELELANARAQVGEARAAAAEGRREFARLTQLHERGAASKAKLDSADTAQSAALSRLQAARARLGVAERALRDSNVEAPFAGLVARRMVSRGEFMSPGEPLLELVALDPVEVEFHLPEMDSSRVKPGADVDVRVAPFPDEVFDARVTMIAPTIDPRTRTLRVKAELANPDGRLRPGLFARADLGVASRDDVPMVPEEAVLQRADGAIVFRLNAEGRVERLRIETAGVREGEVEVAFGLKPGDLVVTRGHMALLDGSPVRAQRSDGSPLASVAAPGASASAPTDGDQAELTQ